VERPVEIGIGAGRNNQQSCHQSLPCGGHRHELSSRLGAQSPLAELLVQPQELPCVLGARVPLASRVKNPPAHCHRVLVELRGELSGPLPRSFDSDRGDRALQSHQEWDVPTSSRQGLTQRKPGNRAKSVSVEYRMYPRWIANVARWASVVRFPAVPRTSKACRSPSK